MHDPTKNPETAAFILKHSWEVHRQAFGPILETAFVGNPQVRLMLTGALNHISRREMHRGMELLREVQTFCRRDADRAACAFFVGLCFELAGDREKMAQWYEKAGEFGHRFYLPYLKLAKRAHQKDQWDLASGYYKTAIACLLEMPEKDRDEIILGSAHSNLTSCLTMLHRYTEAEAVWTAAGQYHLLPASYATGAVLYAAMGNREKTNAYLDKLRAEYPELLGQIQTMTGQILAGEHPAFQPEV